MPTHMNEFASANARDSEVRDSLLRSLAAVRYAALSIKE